MQIESSQNRGTAGPLARDALRIPLERAVSEHLGWPWTAQSIMDMSDFACHPCAILSDGTCAVFAKYSDAPNGSEQFEIELAGLRLLSELAGVRTPAPIGIVAVPGGTILVLEAVQAVERSPGFWRQVGRTLAHIHAIEGECFGLDRDGYFGPLYQDNTPASDWPTFYVERRLWPGLRMAIDSGNLPPAMIQQVEQLIARVPQLCGPEVVPTLLHGDAQQNNYISTELGPVVIDPAVHYGHPEMDLAQVDLFAPVPEDLFDGYQDARPIDPGFWERRDLWRVWGYLASVAAEGRDYLPQLTEAVQKYL